MYTGPESRNWPPNHPPSIMTPAEGVELGAQAVRKGSRKGLIIGLIVGLFVLACLGGSTLLALSSAVKTPQGNSAVHTVPELNREPAAAPATKTGPAITAKDIALVVKITSKQCFGSAGCSVQFRIDASTDLGKLKACDKDYEVTYEIAGLSQSQIGTLTLHPDGTYEQDDFQFGDTKSSKPKLTAKVTSVEEQL